MARFPPGWTPPPAEDAETLEQWRGHATNAARLSGHERLTAWRPGTTANEFSADCKSCRLTVHVHPIKAGSNSPFSGSAIRTNCRKGG